MGVRSSVAYATLSVFRRQRTEAKNTHTHTHTKQGMILTWPVSDTFRLYALRKLTACSSFSKQSRRISSDREKSANDEAIICEPEIRHIVSKATKQRVASVGDESTSLLN